MAKNPRQAEKLLRLQHIFWQETDEAHPLTVPELLERLASFGIRAERKSIYDNIDVLNRCGMDIVAERRGSKVYYYTAGRDFDPAELRMLADAVSSSRFITRKKSDELMEKLGTLCSRHQASRLRRRLHVASRTKNMNETIFYTVDQLYRAMDENVAVTFLYYDWKLEGGVLKRSARHEGARYLISPWQLLWLEENYYLIGYDHAKEAIRHYRVDRMGDLVLMDTCRKGERVFNALGLETYTSRVFGMFGGEPCRAVITFPPRLLEVMVDRFGKELRPAIMADGRLQIRPEVVPSLPFFGWLFSLGSEVTLEGELKEAYLRQLNKTIKENENG